MATITLSDRDASTVIQSLNVRAETVWHYARSERAAGNVTQAQTYETVATELATLADSIRAQVTP